ncbi:MAG: oxidoreductase, partial [Blastomonas fulva]
MDIAICLALAIAGFAGLGLVALIAGDRHARVTGLVLEAGMLACLALGVAAVAQIVRAGPATTDLLVWHQAGLSVRLDAVSLPIMVLVAFIGWVVLRYSRTYMAEEPRRAYFQAWLAFTLASVLLLALAGNLVQLALAWIATSLCLHRLLLFYPHRAAAQRVARKKAMTARVADAALIGAVA